MVSPTLRLSERREASLSAESDVRGGERERERRRVDDASPALQKVAATATKPGPLSVPLRQSRSPSPGPRPVPHRSSCPSCSPCGRPHGPPPLVGANLGLLLVILPQQRRAKAGGPGAPCGALCASPHTLPAHCPLRLATVCLPRSCACPKGRRTAAAPVRACAVKLRALLLLRLLLPPPGGRVG